MLPLLLPPALPYTPSLIPCLSISCPRNREQGWVSSHPRPEPGDTDLPVKPRGSVRGLMNFPKSSANIPRAFSMRCCWKGTGEAEDELWWKCRWEWKAEEDCTLIHPGARCRERGGTKKYK